MDSIKDWLNLSYKECIRNYKKKREVEIHNIQPAEGRQNLMMMMMMVL